MIKKKIKKKIDLKLIIQYLSLSIIIPILISLILLKNIPIISSGKEKRLISIKFQPTFNISNEFVILLRNSTQFSFNSYYNNCLGYDELRPISKNCLKTFGFYSTLVESLETLILLDLKEEYLKSINFLKKNLNCNNLGLINRREMFSRLIGSLIGSYLLASDSFFLDMAEQCSQNAIKIDELTKYPRPYHNYNNFTSIERMWINGTALQDVSPGMPELLSLYYITNNDIYLNHVKRILSKLPKTPNVYHYSVLTIPRGLNGTTMRRMDGFTVGFYHNLAIAHGLYPLFDSGYVLNNTEPLIHVSYDENQEIFYPLLDSTSNVIDTFEQFFYPGIEKMFEDALNNHKNPEKLFFKGNFNKVSGYRFESSFLRVLFRFGSIEKNYYLINLINYVLNKTKVLNGFSGIKHSNKGLEKFDDVQHSSFFSQFLKIGALIINNNNFHSNNFIFNEKGHILKSNFLLQNPKINSFKRCIRNGTRAHNLFC